MDYYTLTRDRLYYLMRRRKEDTERATGVSVRFTISIVAFAVLVTGAGAARSSQPQSANARPPSAKTEQASPATRKHSDECTKHERFVGEVKRGQDFTQNIGGGLVFHLRAWHDPAIEGWRIDITPKKPGRNGVYHSYAWQLNPPYHYYNSTDVDVSYDVTAKQAVEWGSREVRFPLTELEALRADELVEILGSNTGAVFDKALEEMKSMRSGKAVFTIINSRLGESGPENGKGGRIEWLKFELRITLPCDFPANQNN